MIITCRYAYGVQLQAELYCYNVKYISFIVHFACRIIVRVELRSRPRYLIAHIRCTVKAQDTKDTFRDLARN